MNNETPEKIDPSVVIAVSCKMCGKATCNCPLCIKLKGGQGELCFSCVQIMNIENL
jgi:hypothetical protein